MKKYKVGYTQGVFDMFHIGHLNLLNSAKQYCEFLIVGINSDDLVREYKEKKPVVCEEDRKEIVANIKAVDMVLIASTLDKLAVLKDHHFDAIFIGDDWRNNPRWEKTKSLLAERGIDVIFLPYTPNVSSTILREMRKKTIQERSE